MLLQKVAAQDGSMSEQELIAALDELVALLPAIESRLASLKPELLLRLAKDRSAVTQKLLHLKSAFPDADCGKMLAKELGLMGQSAASLHERAHALRDFLPRANIDAIASVRTSRWPRLLCLVLLPALSVLLRSYSRLAFASCVQRAERALCSMLQLHHSAMRALC